LLKNTIERIQRIRIGYDIIANTSKAAIVAKLKDEKKRESEQEEITIKKEFNEQLKDKVVRILETYQNTEKQYVKLSEDYVAIIQSLSEELDTIGQVNKV
jgi:predicted  nucleic acid-binding Zn-ribbon protein